MIAEMNKLAEMQDPNQMKVWRWFMSQKGMMVSNANLMFGHGGWGAQARKMKILNWISYWGDGFRRPCVFLSFGAFPGTGGKLACRGRVFIHEPRGEDDK